VILVWLPAACSPDTSAKVTPVPQTISEIETDEPTISEIEITSTDVLSSQSESTVTPTVAIVSTTTPLPIEALDLPLFSETLNPVDDSPWTEWVNQLLVTNTDCAPYSSDLSLAAFRSDKFRVYDPRTNELKWEFDMPIEPVGGGPIVFSPDNQILAHGGSDQILHIWDAHTGDLLHEIDFERQIFDIKFTGDGQWMVVNYGVEAGVLAAVNVLSGEIIRFPIHAPVSDEAVSTNDSRIGVFLHDVVENGEERILTWDPETDEVSTLIPLSPDDWVLYEDPDGIKRYYGGRINISPDGNFIALLISGETERNFHLWSTSEQKWVYLQESAIARKESVLDFQFSPNSSYFALFSGSALDGVNRVRVWQTSGEFVGEIAEKAGNVSSIQCPHRDESFIHYVNAFTSFSFTPDDLYLSTFGYDQNGKKRVVLWSLNP
jgi:WD40 repeat protein